MNPSFGGSLVLGNGDHCVCALGDAGRGRETFNSEASKVKGLPNEKLDRLYTSADRFVRDDRGTY